MYATMDAGNRWPTVQLQDLESKIRNQTELFSKPDTMLAYRQNFQMLSPLLYCNQIQLNDTDVDVTDDGLIVVMMTLHFLSDVANDAESTQNQKLRHYR